MKNTLTLASLVVATTLSTIGGAVTHIRIQRDTVIPVVFEDTLRLDRNRKGDIFYARVDDGLDLPWGTRFVGHVISVRPPNSRRAGFMDLEFNYVEFPNGDREKVSAIPVHLDSKFIRKDRDGRMVAVIDDRERENKVLGGALGGLVLGSIFRKPAEGFIIGAIAGIIGAETDHRKDGDLVVDNGQRMGAMIDRSIELEWKGEFRRYRSRDLEEEARIDREFRLRHNREGGNESSADPRRDDPRRDDPRRDDPRRDDPRRDDQRRADGEIEIRFEKRTLTFDRNQMPFRNATVVMVPLQKAASQLNIEVDPGRNSQTYLTSSEGTLRIEIGSQEARWNGKPIRLDKAVEDRNGVLFVSIDVFDRLKGAPLQILGNVIDR